MYGPEWIKHNYDFSDNVIVITGGTGVIGTVITAALLALGARVAVLTRNPDKAQAMAKDRQPDKLILLKSDVTRRDRLEENALEIEKRLGPVTTLINAAGGNRPAASTGDEQTFFDLNADELHAVFSLNLLGTITPCQVFARQMAAQQRGCIVNISSMAAQKPLTRVPAYAAAKAGVDNFTRWLAVHMAQEYSPAIRVNALAPGFFLTEQNRFLLVDEATGQYTKRGETIVKHTPMQRLGSPDDLVSTLLWLLSPASRFVTGVIIPVDGGFSAFGGV